MICKSCHYPLTNIRDRVCPECGSPFLPSDFELVPNSVEFCCPHCAQAYFGTDNRGHLEPVLFTCSSCQTHIHMDEMTLKPAEDLTPIQCIMVQNPWLIRPRGSFFKAWFRTAWWAMIRPGSLISGHTDNNTTTRAWHYLLAMIVIVYTLTMLPFMLLFGVIAISSGGSLAMLAPTLVVWIIAILIGLVSTVVFTIIWAWTINLILKLTGTCEGTCGSTIRALCYASGANLASAVPCLGSYFGWLWWLAAAVFTVKQTHRISGLRASLATLAFPSLILAITIGLYVWFIVWSVNTAATMPRAMQTQTFNSQPLLAQLVQTQTDQEVYPAHALELMDMVTITPQSYLTQYSSTPLWAINVGDYTLDQFFSMSHQERDKAVQAQAAIIKASGQSVYRVGDTVFTYAGLEPHQDIDELWLFIRWPDPKWNDSLAADDTVTIGKMNASTAEVSVESFDQLLIDQNKLRKSLGLEPIPNPEQD